MGRCAPSTTRGIQEADYSFRAQDYKENNSDIGRGYRKRCGVCDYRVQIQGKFMVNEFDIFMKGVLVGIPVGLFIGFILLTLNKWSNCLEKKDKKIKEYNWSGTISSEKEYKTWLRMYDK